MFIVVHELCLALIEILYFHQGRRPTDYRNDSRFGFNY